MKWKLLFILTTITISTHSQVGIGTSTVDSSASLQLNSTSKGLLIPRMNTAQRTGIVLPATGLMVYDTDFNQFYFYNGVAWIQSIGPSGENGKTILNGTTVPPAVLGTNGDFYLRTTNGFLYGPKSGGGWGVPISLIGSQGLPGENGKTILSGNTSPTSGIGTIGDFYLDTATRNFYGPKNGAGWGVPVSLTGPQGPSGTTNNLSMNFSFYPDAAILPKGNWTMGPGAKQATLTTAGALVNITVTTKLVTGASPSAVFCNICYGTSASGTGIPIKELEEALLVGPITLNSITYQPISLSGKVTPLASGTYWLAPCFMTNEHLNIMGGMGYAIILE